MSLGLLVCWATYDDLKWFISQRVHVHNNLVLGIWVIVIIVQVLGKYMIIGYVDPQGM